jgi:hypothetical protein
MKGEVEPIAVLWYIQETKSCLQIGWPYAPCVWSSSHFGKCWSFRDQKTEKVSWVLLNVRIKLPAFFQVYGDRSATLSIKCSEASCLMIETTRRRLSFMEIETRHSRFTLSAFPHIYILSERKHSLWWKITSSDVCINQKALDT